VEGVAKKREEWVKNWVARKYNKPKFPRGPVPLLSGSQVHTIIADPDLPDQGSGAFLTPGSGIPNRFFPDTRSWIPNPYFRKLSDNFLGIKFYNSLKIGPDFFFSISKRKKLTILLNLWLQ
jgi:hypothetical protein